MTKTARRLALRDAAAIIADELADGQDVRIPGFGLFRVRDLRVRLDLKGREQTHVIGVVHFRPFSRLKGSVRDMQPRCPAVRGFGIAALASDRTRCVHRDDHRDDHEDEKGRTWS
jgi:nucleoid DNA-binding protein